MIRTACAAMLGLVIVAPCSGQTSQGDSQTLQVFGNQFDKHLLKLSMKNGSSPSPQPELTCSAVPIVMFKDWQTEPKNSLVATVVGLRMS